MKIHFLDYPDKKISHWHEKHWQEQGHEVDFDMYHHPDKIKWSDVTIYFWCEGSAQELSRLDPKEYPCRKIIQCVDIDAYYGHWGAVNWDNIDKMVFMSKHIQSFVNRNLSTDFKDIRGNQVHIPLGIDLKQWKFKKRDGKGKKVGMLAAEWWATKNPSLALQFIHKVVDRDPEFTFDWRGIWGTDRWLYEYTQHMVKAMGLEKNVTIIPERIGDLNEWWDGIDYFLTFSQKDSYSIILGEAMAKGIKTLSHNWWGARDIWGEKYTWSTIDEGVEKLFADDYNSNEYRTYIEKNHDINNVLKKWDEILVR